MKRLEFEQLCQAALEGICTTDEFARLQEALAESPENRRLFRETFVLHEMLQAESELLKPSTDRPALIPVDSVLRDERRRDFRRAVAAAAAVVLLALLSLQIVRSREVPPDFRLTAAPNSKYTVTRTGDPDAPPDELSAGSQVHLVEGTLELEFSNGVHSIVQGPARFTLQNPMRLALEEGSARLEVPEPARGFTVVTPRIEAVDLGTAFGVIERLEQPAQVHVFDGHVRVGARTGAREMRTLNAGVAVEASIPGRLRAIAADRSLFFEKLPPDLPFIHLSFEPDPSAGGLAIGGHHPAVGSATARLHPKGAGLADGVVGKAARFDGRATPVETDWPGVGGSAPRTIAAWIRQEPGLPHRPYQTIAGWGDPTIGLAAKCELLLYRARPRSPTVLRLSFDQFLFSGTTDLADGRWHHVAAVCRPDPAGGDAPLVDLYVDGRREFIDPATSSIAPPMLRGPHTRISEGNAMPLVIGHTDRPARNRGFRGMIDELYVFEAALGPERIRQLATPPAGDR